MHQERLDAVEFLPLAANPFQTVVDHLFAPDYVAMGLAVTRPISSVLRSSRVLPSLVRR